MKENAQPSAQHEQSCDINIFLQTRELNTKNIEDDPNGPDPNGTSSRFPLHVNTTIKFPVKTQDKRGQQKYAD